MIRVGIFGAAKVATYALIAPARANEHVDIIAVAASDGGRARAYADEHEIADALEGYDALIARDDIDLIYNALPPSRHAGLSIAALESGKHVLCEKPFAMNAGEAARMVDAARTADRHLIEAFHYRFHPAFLRLETLIAEGAIGDVQRIESVFNVAIPYRADSLRHDPALGGGALMDLGCYPLHMARTLANGDVQVEEAQCLRGESGVDLYTRATLGLGDIRAEIACDMREGAEFHAHLLVEGSAGTAMLTNPVHPQKGHELTLTRGSAVEVETLTDRGTYDFQLDHVAAVLKGETEPVTGGADAVATMAAIDAIYAAAS
ncbi:MAG: Gfo/Idh/MocA family oxidoreductase [Pacificimonas sp.]